MASLPLPLEPYAAPDDWPAAQLRPQLAELAEGLDDRFVRAGARLAEVIDTIGALQGGLDTMNRALDDTTAATAVAQLRAAARRIEQLPAMLCQRDADLVEVGRLIRRLDGHIADILRQLQMLGIYGMNIKIAGAGGDFRIFVDDMAGRLKTGEAEIASFARRLTSVMQSVVPVRNAYAQVLSAQTGVSHDVHERIAQCGARLETHLAGSGAMAGELAALAGQVQHSVGGVLGAIQVADSTRQRIEHVVSAIDIAARAMRDRHTPPGAADHVARLIAALIDATGQDHASQGRALTDSLDRLTAAGDDLARLLDSQVARAGTSSLDDLESGIGTIAQMTTQLTETTVRADAMVSSIADAADELTHRLESIDQIVRDVKEIAINTRLLCLRQGQTGVAVAVIAVEVAQQAARLKQTAADIAGEIDQLDTLNQGLRGTDPQGVCDDSIDGDLGATLEMARAAIAEACRHSDDALGQGEVAARRLMAQLDAVAAVVGDEDRLVQALARISRPAASALSSPASMLDAAAQEWLRDVLPRIGALYTMAEERTIHAGFAVPGMAVEPLQTDTPLVEAVEQDEDGFF
jgi:methyl-accepting chemotaxis protein